MKKKITLALSAIALIGSAIAQNVPNGSFENGSTTVDGWVINGGTLLQSLDVNENGNTTKRFPTNGSRFLGIRNVISGSTAFPGFASTTFALTTKPPTMRFDAMYFRSAAIAEPWTVFFFFWDSNGGNRDTVLFGSTTFQPVTVGNWAPAVIDLSTAYRGTALPDSATITFFINSVGGQLSQDAALFLDGVRLSEYSASSTDLTADKWVSAFNNTIYPNPVSNGVAKVSFETIANMEVSVELYDLNGRLVRNAFNGKLDGGKHVIDVNTSDLNSGIYIYKIVTAGGISEGKLIVQ